MTGSHYVARAGLNLIITLPQPPMAGIIGVQFRTFKINSIKLGKGLLPVSVKNFKRHYFSFNQQWGFYPTM
jgi:hypothetical protein